MCLPPAAPRAVSVCLPESGTARPEMREPLPRVRARADFLRVAAARRKWVAPGLLLQVAPATAADRRAMGFTASRKVGNAVHRNGARRRLRAAVDLVMVPHA